jgi:hypothetical protein
MSVGELKGDSRNAARKAQVPEFSSLKTSQYKQRTKTKTEAGKDSPPPQDQAKLSAPSPPSETPHAIMYAHQSTGWERIKGRWEQFKDFIVLSSSPNADRQFVELALKQPLKTPVISAGKPYYTIADVIRPAPSYPDKFVKQYLEEKHKAPSTPRQKAASLIQVPASLPAFPATVYRLVTRNSNYSAEGTNSLPWGLRQGEQVSRDIWDSTTGGVDFERSMDMDENNVVAGAATLVLCKSGLVSGALRKAAPVTAKVTAQLSRAATAVKESSPSVQAISEIPGRVRQTVQEIKVGAQNMGGGAGPGGLRLATEGAPSATNIAQKAASAAQPAARAPGIAEKSIYLTNTVQKAGQIAGSGATNNSKIPKPALPSQPYLSESAVYYKRLRNRLSKGLENCWQYFSDYLQKGKYTKKDLLARIEKLINELKSNQEAVLSEASSEYSLEMRKAWLKNKLSQLEELKKMLSKAKDVPLQEQEVVSQITSEYRRLQDRLWERMGNCKSYISDYLGHNGKRTKEFILKYLNQSINHLLDYTASVLEEASTEVEKLQREEWLKKMLFKLENLKREFEILTNTT